MTKESVDTKYDHNSLYSHVVVFVCHCSEVGPYWVRLI